MITTSTGALPGAWLALLLALSILLPWWMTTLPVSQPSRVREVLS